MGENGPVVELQKIPGVEVPSAPEAPVGQRFMVQKKALRFQTVALIWVVPSLAALFVLPYNFSKADTFLGTLKLVRVEQWLSLLLLLIHPVFISLACYYRRTEAPTEQIVAMEEGPGTTRD